VVYAKVVDKNGKELTNSGSLLAAFNGSSIAGVKGPSSGPSGKIYQLTRFADAPTVSGMTYKFHDASTDKIYSAGEPFTFVSGQNIGSIASPVVLFIKEEQSITFPALGSKTFGEEPFTIGGTSSSGLPLQYSSSDSNVAIVTTNSVADVVTDLGDIPMELLAQSAPVTVANFISYADAGAYSNSIFHRSVPGFVIQGGGYVANANLAPISAKAPITNEYSISNTRGTVAMALVGTNRNSATSQWFINLTNNSSILDNTNIAGNPPFAVFARVLGKGLSVVDSIASLPIYNVGKPFDELPTQGVTNGQVTLMVSNMVSMDIGIVKGPAVVIVGAGTVTIEASQAGNSNYLTATPVTNTLVINKAAASVAITGTNAIYSGTGKRVVVTTTPAGLSNQVTYSGVTNLPTNAGSYPVVATITDVNYTGSGTSTLTIAKASNAIAAFAPIGTRTNGTPPFAITPPTATSSLPVSVTVKSGPASILSNVVTMTGAGTVTLAANQAASANYLAATEVTTSFSVVRGGQSITFGTIAVKVFGDVPFALSAAASSGLPMSYSTASSNISLSGGNVTILGAGTATIVASQGGDNNYTAATPVTNTLVIGKGVASVAITGTNAPYNGAGRAVTVSTVPAGLPVRVTYNGQTNLPVIAGSYAVVATVNSPNYTGSGTGTLVVGKATSSVVLSGLSQTYSGAGRAVTVSTVPAGLPVRVTYNGQTNLPVSAGSYAVAATINSPNYTGSGTVTLVIGKATAKVTLSNLRQIYDGNERPVIVTTMPRNFTVTVTYRNGSAVPVNAGNYPVMATVNDSNYSGVATGILAVARATQTITFSPASPVNFSTNGAINLEATSSSGLPVTYSSSIRAVLAISGSQASMKKRGSSIITASQAGNSNIAPAVSVRKIIRIW
jgi:cyclophilin family peptidyl-prolyl cis-trans isomerase